MSDLTAIAETLKAARKASGLTQHALSQRLGIPQSHLSKIESGKVDLKTASLIEIARALGLELMLVPRAIVPAVKGLERARHADGPIPAYRLDDEGNADD